MRTAEHTEPLASDDELLARYRADGCPEHLASLYLRYTELVYGVALGIVTFAIRYWGSYTEGVSFALLFMNLWVPYINDMTRQTPYGYVKPAKKEAAGK